MKWAHARALAAATANAMGPSEGIGSTYRKNSGPIRLHRQQLLQMQWAHARALGAAASKLMGPCEAIGNILLKYDSGPTRSICPLYLMGPLIKIAHFCLMGQCGLSRVHRSNCTWVLSTATTNICYIMCTFDPQNEAHLRELEECIGLDPNSVRKARYIKPAIRRQEGQTHAYAILSLTSPSMANHLIRKGITVCGVKMLPTKLKHEPMQCLRCRDWGHLIVQCLNTEVCGACREEHSTSNCDNSHKRYCTSCKVNTHASWDRGCPEFICCCEIHNSRYPENNLLVFPTDEEWTLITRPEKIQSKTASHSGTWLTPSPQNQHLDACNSKAEHVTSQSVRTLIQPPKRTARKIARTTPS
jgi:hypothetical protein